MFTDLATARIAAVGCSNEDLTTALHSSVPAGDSYISYKRSPGLSDLG
jgi:hypothetical protein